ncbi:WXG100 family type VII secretion target [Nocardia sp. NPDC003979]
MTSADAYRVNLEELDTAIETMVKFGTTVEEWVAEVERHIAELHVIWSGEAAAAHQGNHAKWRVGVAEMKENLDELREVAKRAHTNYSAAINTNTAMWP